MPYTLINIMRPYFSNSFQLNAFFFAFFVYILFTAIDYYDAQILTPFDIHIYKYIFCLVAIHEANWSEFQVDAHQKNKMKTKILEMYHIKIDVNSLSEQFYTSNSWSSVAVVIFKLKIFISCDRNKWQKKQKYTHVCVCPMC